MIDNKIIVGVEDVVEKVLLDKRFARTKEIQRLIVEAGILSMTRAEPHTWNRLAEETFASLTEDVLAQIKASTGVSIIKKERSTIRTMDNHINLSDKTGMVTTLSRGFSGYACMCPFRDKETVSLTWFN